MSIVVSDTSSISALFRLEKLEVLPALYGEVLIPPVVYAELLNLAAFGYDLTSLTSATWLKVVAPKD
jgi:predicted nucleic acid-binding protein